MAATAVIQDMDASSDDDVHGGAGILSLADDPEFSDVQPLDLREPERPVVAIQYSEEARQRLAYLYALAKAGEASERVFRLTAQVIGTNPANYTAWICRWRCLRAGHGSKAAELAFLQGCTLAGGAKNYQLWNHRRRVALQLGALDIAEEMRFAADCLALEPKNYHAWAHRQAVLQAAAAGAAAASGPAATTEERAAAADVVLQAAAGGTTATGPAATAAHGAAAADDRSGRSEFELRGGEGGGHPGAGCSTWWAAELQYVDSCIGADVRDNSAWAQRFFLLSNSPALFAEPAGDGGGGGGATYGAVADHELAFVAEQLQRGAHNGSAWNYLRGLLTLPGGGDAWVHDERLPRLCCQVLAEEPSCVGALELLADMYAARAAAAAQQQDAGVASAARVNAAALWRELTLADPVRRYFWHNRLMALQETCPA